MRFDRLFGNDPAWRRFVLKWAAVSLVFHLIAAYFSVGYHSADEQFQILEFLAYKLGLAPASSLAVEFPERMRPWLQPGIYYAITRGAQALGIDNPFDWAFLFRLFTGLVGWLSTVGLMLCSRFWFSGERARRLAVLALTLTWFLPALHARPSSESLGGSGFLLGLSIATLSTELGAQGFGPWFLAGAAAGVGFEARFQLGLMIAGWVAYLCLRESRVRVPWRSIAALLAGGAVIFALGRVVDHWGYDGQWVLSPWRYFSYNLVRGEVSRYGAAPWWDVFRMSFTESWPVLGTILAVACVVAWFRHPGQLLTWAAVPFFLVHELIAHKELRFFFPIAMAAPVFLVLAFIPRGESELPRWPWGKWRPAVTVVVALLLALNAVALLALSFVPFSRTVQYYQGVYRALPDPRDARAFRLYTTGRDPFEVLGTPIYFYRAPGLQVRPVPNYREFHVLLRGAAGQDLYLFSPHAELPPDASFLDPACQRVFSTLPAWVTRLDVMGWVERTNIWSLYRCRE